MKRFKIDYSFLLLLCIISLSPKQSIIVKLFLCLFIHEIGHLFFITLFRYKIEKLELSIFGFFLKLENTKEEFYKDFIIYFGGIFFNLILYFLIPDETMRKINLILILFNSLPIYPLDGFNIIKTSLSYFFPYRFVLKMMSIVSLFGGVAGIGISIYFKMDIFIILNATYLFFLSLEYYFKEQLLYQKFLLDKQIYKKKYPVKTIHFHTNFQNYFYKYHTIQMSIGNKFFTEEELLDTQNRIT
ncbi:MAG: hypothetical protein K2M08_06080 [Anaeroplasmataceae bacterium]|nr:hypothetical protein [Anaeroplasmataceae bacterium]